MQEENLRDDVQSMSVEEMFLQSQETYDEAQQRAAEDSKKFAKRNISGWIKRGFTVCKCYLWLLIRMEVSGTSNAFRIRKALIRK